MASFREEATAGIGQRSRCDRQNYRNNSGVGTNCLLEVAVTV
jgi:hypothetical protein